MWLIFLRAGTLIPMWFARCLSYAFRIMKSLLRRSSKVLITFALGSIFLVGLTFAQVAIALLASLVMVLVFLFTCLWKLSRGRSCSR